MKRRSTALAMLLRVAAVGGPASGGQPVPRGGQKGDRMALRPQDQPPAHLALRRGKQPVRQALQIGSRG